MVVPNARLKNIKGPVQVLEALLEVATVVIVHGKCFITVSYCRVINAEQTFLQNDYLGLQLDSLQVISKFKLNAGDIRNASCNFFICGPSHL